MSQEMREYLGYDWDIFFKTRKDPICKSYCAFKPDLSLEFLRNAKKYGAVESRFTADGAIVVSFIKGGLTGNFN